MTTTPDTFTTDNLPAVTRNSELDRLARLGQWLAATEGKSDPKGRDGMASALRFYYAEQLGLPAPAVAELTVINGRLFVGAQLLRALAERGGYRVIRKESTDETCTAGLIRADTGEELGTATFTIEQAQKAGLIRDRSPWKSHPARMLWARASKNVITDFAPAVALGIMIDDEIQEVTRTTDAIIEPDDYIEGEEVEIEWPGEAPED